MFEELRGTFISIPAPCAMGVLSRDQHDAEGSHEYRTSERLLTT